MVIRWLTLVIVVMNILFNFTYPFFTNLVSVKEVSDAHPSLMSPAPYTFSIWSLIYFAFLIYSVLQLKPSNRQKNIFDLLSGHLLIINLCCSGWLLLYTQNWIGLSLLLNFLACIIAYRAFRNAYLAVHYRNHNLWLQFPFSLIAGWLTVAVGANLAVFLKHLGWHAGFGDTGLALLFMSLMCVLAFTISIRSYSLVYPGAIAWGLIGIAVARQGDHFMLSNACILMSAVLIIAVFIAGLYRKFRVNKSLEEQMEF